MKRIEECAKIFSQALDDLEAVIERDLVEVMQSINGCPKEPAQCVGPSIAPPMSLAAILDTTPERMRQIRERIIKAAKGIEALWF